MDARIGTAVMARARLALVVSLFAGMTGAAVVAPAEASGPSAQSDQLLGFVYSFYTGVLGRTPDQGGATGWATFLAANCDGQGVGAFAAGVFGSAEFQTKAMSLPDLIALLYQTFLGRSPDPGGLAAWESVVRQARVNMAVTGFIPSPEFQHLVPNRSDPAEVTAVVTRFYTQILGRSPDADGLAGWVDYIVATHDLEGVAEAFLGSPEFESQSLSLQGYVTVLYEAFLGREPDPANLQQWAGMLQTALLQMINTGFIASAEFNGIVPLVCSPSITNAGSGTLANEVTFNGITVADNGGFCTSCFTVQQNFWIRSGAGTPLYWVQNVLGLRQGASGQWYASHDYEVWSPTAVLLEASPCTYGSCQWYPFSFGDVLSVTTTQTPDGKIHFSASRGSQDLGPFVSHLAVPSGAFMFVGLEPNRYEVQPELAFLGYGNGSQATFGPGTSGTVVSQWGVPGTQVVEAARVGDVQACSSSGETSTGLDWIVNGSTATFVYAGSQRDQGVVFVDAQGLSSAWASEFCGTSL